MVLPLSPCGMNMNMECVCVCVCVFMHDLTDILKVKVQILSIANRKGYMYIVPRVESCLKTRKTLHTTSGF